MSHSITDIDVLLVAGSDADVEQWDSLIDEFEQQSRTWTGNRCRCLVFTVDRVRRLAADNEPIVADWVADGVLLAGKRIADVIADHR